jgi:hypothetical protein
MGSACKEAVKSTNKKKRKHTHWQQQAPHQEQGHTSPHHEGKPCTRGLGPLGRLAQVLPLLAQSVSGPVGQAGIHRLLTGLLPLDSSRRCSRWWNCGRSQGCHDRSTASRTSWMNSGGGWWRNILGLAISCLRKGMSSTDSMSPPRLEANTRLLS